MTEQSPIIDNVSAATFSSFGVKKAVSEALKEAGKDFGNISFTTEKEHGKLTEKEDLNVNLVIVGGGPSGLAADISAKESGIQDVTLVEKLDILSGNGKFDMNFFDIINSQAMNKNNNVVSKEDFLKNKEKAWDSDERKQAYYIYDQNLYESFYRLKKHNNLGYHMKADTLEELADKLSINKENLIETVKKYNKAFEDGQKDEFRDKMPEKKFLEQGPYYGVPIESAIHMTKGGVVANEKAQVINNEDKVVEGLYASGEVTDTAGAYSSSVIFGRIAGEEAAKFLSE